MQILNSYQALILVSILTSVYYVQYMQSVHHVNAWIHNNCIYCRCTCMTTTHTLMYGLEIHHVVDLHTKMHIESKVHYCVCVRACVYMYAHYFFTHLHLL